MIKVTLADQDYYRIKIISGPSWEEDSQRLQEIPSYKVVYVDKKGGSVPSHGRVPRIDLQEIVALFKPRERLFSKTVKNDLRLYRQLLNGVDTDNTYTRKIKLRNGLILWGHQDEFVRKDWLVNRLFNNLPTGSGKSICALVRVILKGAKRVLIITVNNVWMDWVKEILKLYGVKPLEYKGPPAKRKQLRRKVIDNQFVLASYGLAHELNGYMFDAFIFDEQDLLANPETQRCQRLMPLFESTWSSSKNQVIVQTATPTGNTPSTAYMAFWLIHPLLAGSYECFRGRHEKLVEFEYKKFPMKGKDGVVRWQSKRIEKRVEFTNKEQLVDTFKNYSSQQKVIYPFKHIKRVQMLEMTASQKEHYDELKEKLESTIGQRHIKVKDIRVRMLRLLQCSEGLFNFDRDCLDSSKLEFIVDFIKRTSHKCLFWSRFRPIGEIIVELFPDRCVILNGGMTEAEKFINRIAFNGASNKDQIRQYEKLTEARYIAGLRKHIAAGNPQETYVPAKIFKPGECQFFASVIHTNTSRGQNLQAADYAMYTTISYSGYAMQQTDGRHARFDSKHKKIYSKYLLNEGTGEVKQKEFVEQRLLNMKLTSDGDEKISVDDAKTLAKMMIRGD